MAAFMAPQLKVKKKSAKIPAPKPSERSMMGAGMGMGMDPMMGAPEGTANPKAEIMQKLQELMALIEAL